MFLWTLIMHFSHSWSFSAQLPKCFWTYWILHFFLPLGSFGLVECRFDNPSVIFSLNGQRFVNFSLTLVFNKTFLKNCQRKEKFSTIGSFFSKNWCFQIVALDTENTVLIIFPKEFRSDSVMNSRQFRTFVVVKMTLRTKKTPIWQPSQDIMPNAQRTPKLLRMFLQQSAKK